MSTDEETDLAHYGEHLDPSDFGHQASLLKLGLSKAMPGEVEDKATVSPQSVPPIQAAFRDRLQRFSRCHGVFIKTCSNAMTLLSNFGNTMARELSDKLNTKLQSQQAETAEAIAKKEAASIRWKQHYDKMREHADARSTEIVQLKEDFRAEREQTMTAMNQLRAEHEQTTMATNRLRAEHDRTTTAMNQLRAERDQMATETNQLRANNIELRKKEQDPRKKEQELKEDLEREKRKQQLARNAEIEVMQKRHKEELQKERQRWSHVLTDLEVKNNDLCAAQGRCIHSPCRECDPKPEHQPAKDEPVVRPNLPRAQSMVSVSPIGNKQRATASTIEELFKMTQEQVLSYQGFCDGRCVDQEFCCSKLSPDFQETYHLHPITIEIQW